MSLLPEISQASAEINKLVAQANIHQTIAPVDPAAFTDPADTMLLASRDPVIREVSVGMTGVEAVQNTVSGTPPLSLPNSLGKPLKAWAVEVSPNQEGTGDPAPDNVRPIHGTDKLTITTAGKNLLDPAKRQNTATNVYWYRNTSGFLLMAGVTYTFSISVTSAQNSIEGIGGSQLAVNYGKTSLTYTPSTDVYVWFNAYFTGGYTPPSGDTSDVQCQLEFGSTASDYSPYVMPSQTTITLPRTVYTGTIGSEGGESRWTKKRITAFNGAWGATANGFAVYASVWDGIRAGVQMCDKFAFSTSGYTDMPVYSWYGGSGANTSFTFILPSTITSLSEANQWIADNGGYIEFTYQLNTPTTFAVSSPTIPTPTGTATTWATAEDGTVESMEVTYYKSE